MDRGSSRRVAIVYRNPLLRDIVSGVLTRHPRFKLVGAFSIDNLRPEQVARLSPTDLVVDEDVVDDSTDPTAVDQVWRTLTYDGPMRLVVLGMTGSCIRILSGHGSTPGEADLVGALSAA